MVKKGDKVKAFQTPLGTLGNGNSSTSFNKMAAHLHHEISETKTPEEMKAYVIGKGLKHVEENYKDPSSTDYDRMFGKKMDVGKIGYAFKQKIIGKENSYHPGVDVNGNNTTGNQDFGWKFTSPVDGVVIYEWRGWTGNGGWGNLIMIEETEAHAPAPVLPKVCNNQCPKHCA
jgi:hypothetical protein